MKKRLSTEDRQAVDLLLERPDGHGDTPLVDRILARPVKDRFEARLDQVERLLSLLENLPAGEPTPDLAARTLRRIEEGSRPQLTPQQILSRDSRPHA